MIKTERWNLINILFEISDNQFSCFTVCWPARFFPTTSKTLSQLVTGRSFWLIFWTKVKNKQTKWIAINDNISNQLKMYDYFLIRSHFHRIHFFPIHFPFMINGHEVLRTSCVNPPEERHKAPSGPPAVYVPGKQATPQLSRDLQEWASASPSSSLKSSPANVPSSVYLHVSPCISLHRQLPHRQETAGEAG